MTISSTWTDNQKNRHDVLITVAVARRLKAECELDLMACIRKPEGLHQILHRFADNPEEIVAALSVIEDSKDPTAFAGLFDGEALEAASEALLSGIADFFPSRPKKALLALLTRCKQAAEMTGDKAVEDIETLLNSPDFLTAVSTSITHGSGSNDSSASLDKTGTD